MIDLVMLGLFIHSFYPFRTKLILSLIRGCPHAPVEVQASVTGSNCINIKVGPSNNSIIEET